MKRSYIEADPVVERFAGLDLGPESKVSLIRISDIERKKRNLSPTDKHPVILPNIFSAVGDTLLYCSLFGYRVVRDAHVYCFESQGVEGHSCV